MNRPSKSIRKLLSESLETSIIITENNSRHQGVSITNHLRIFIFETESNNISIDFIRQQISPNGMSIVPPNHVHIISVENKSNFLCIEVGNSILKKDDVNLLLAIKYLKQKQLKGRDNDIIHYKLIKSLIGADFNQEALYQLLKNSIVLRMKYQFGGFTKNNSKYIKLSEKFLLLINNTKIFTVDHTCVNVYSDLLNCSEKALLRCCLSVFNLTAQELLKYHLFLNALYWISDFDKPVYKVAARLGYSSQSAFSKFIKSQTNQSLSDIRKQIKEQVSYH